MYKEHFGFRELPFANTLESSHFYLNPVYEDALMTLEFGLQASKDVIVVTGEPGTGKTMLVRKFLATVTPRVQAIQIVKTAFSFAETLRASLILSDVIRQDANPVGSLEAFRQHLERCAQSGAVTCLVVDEAEHFDDETFESLRELLNLAGSWAKALQLILVGQPALMTKLDRPGLSHVKQRVALHCRLVPLTRSEVRRYINFHMERAGGAASTVFTPAAVVQVALYSGGIPRLVNHLCDNALLSAYRCRRTEITPDVIDEIAQELRLADPDPPVPTAVHDEPSNIDSAKPAPVSQVADVSSNLHWQNQEAAPIGRVPTRERKSGRKISAIALSVAILGLGTAALYREDISNLDLSGMKFHGDARGEIAADIVPARGQETLPADRNSSHDRVALETSDGAGPEIDGAAKEPAREAGPARLDAPTRQARPNGGDTAVPQGAPAAPNPAAGERDLERKINLAISNRAIEGVSVNIVDGTAILAGRVASERQKAMAERAARGVQKLAAVENRIKIQP